jgi:hypothetical protein
MNSDTLDLGERERDRHVRSAVGGTAAAVGCPLQPLRKGRGMLRGLRCAQPYAFFCFSVDQGSTGFVSFGAVAECCLFKIKQVTVDGIIHSQMGGPARHSQARPVWPV